MHPELLTPARRPAREPPADNDANGDASRVAFPAVLAAGTLLALPGVAGPLALAALLVGVLAAGPLALVRGWRALAAPDVRLPRGLHAAAVRAVN